MYVLSLVTWSAGSDVYSLVCGFTDIEQQREQLVNNLDSEKVARAAVDSDLEITS